MHNFCPERRVHFMGLLKIADLTHDDIERHRINHETYRIIYDKCVDSIKARNATGSSWLKFTVVSYIPDRPLYKLEHAKRYVAEKLKRGGFLVEEFEGELVICWDAQKKKAVGKRTRRQIRDSGGTPTKQPASSTPSTSRRSASSSTTRSNKSSRTQQPKPVKIEEPLNVRLARLNFAMNGR